MQGVLGVCERVMAQTKMFFHNAIISAEVLDLFKSSFGVTRGGGPGALTSNALT